GYAIALEDMIALRGERFFELYNGHHMVNNLGDSAHMSTEEMWDQINISYLENDQPLMYGLATDDSHNYHVSGSEWSNAGRGWIMVQVDSLTPSDLIASMEAGAFYATTGVALKTLDFEENRLSIEVEEEAGITYTISFIGCKKGQSQTEELTATEGAMAQFEVTDDLLFVRCRISSTKLHNNPIEEFRYEMAWTQPVTINN
ncbi:MAG: histidinol-phosphatase, partial [Cyclobacteriaceae bacterium]